MVHKKSEYQNQFKACIIKKNQNTYLENLNFRHVRRDREYMHTPLLWGDTTEEDTTSSDSNEDCLSKSNEQHKTLKEPAEKFHSMAEILADSKLKLDEFKKSKHIEPAHADMLEIGKVALEHSTTNSKVKDSADKKCINLETLCLDKDSSNNATSQEIKDDEEDESKQVSSVQEKQKKVEDMRNSKFNLRRKPYHNSKSKASTTSLNSKHYPHVVNGKSRPVNKERLVKHKSNAVLQRETKVPPLVLCDDEKERKETCEPISCHGSVPRLMSNSKPPFISFGIGDVEDSITLHRTHNVRALADVYPTALKAKVRRNRDVKKHVEKGAVTHSAEALLDKLTGTGLKDSSVWESEYSKQFHGYEPKDYERALSARSVIPRTTPRPIPGVHRHGCMVIHVD
ncbi:uncharacterized protein LOC106056941 [Biomphalaria glabrata]|uniref:Uncharacterized protein LOC106056941 n=1 Tax=Biomphalaria glabrata TaxID=6526 RepID=A0A9U8E1T3_BIOGL|nr:uncharacterized protein LOC106056941 [Biomphalaria glabrata]XP_013069343.2 uncharacterized protein LOC106056941 [Biomphalaria glabrata]XP_013069344.2 uncharacterized protein LOC106056941 [Biomphalaria glabrata]XP_013069345.2 uncharacterized protein LOC106056941 [Biomphalaria glabrata]XP_055880086.1 uncharacterized protein LOC106056941 [Biomphalaria glabrata]XP_055880088.1 uncharacterized protein LOC106056941 [Biomphalaria glabrata]